jgi:hypothetical protein
MNWLKKNNKCFPITSFHDTNNVFEKIDLHEKSSLPDEGWIHSCVDCGVYTASTILFTRSTFINKECEFWFYLCKYCKTKISNDVKKYILFSKKCSKMIRKYKIKNIKIDLNDEIKALTNEVVSNYGQTDLEAELPEISIS